MDYKSLLNQNQLKELHLEAKLRKIIWETTDVQEPKPGSQPEQPHVIPNSNNIYYYFRALFHSSVWAS